MRNAEPWRAHLQIVTALVPVDVDNAVSDYDPDDDIRCNCVPEFKGGPTCFDDRCINWATKVECIDCKSGCRNQRLLHNKWANIEVFEAGMKGYGIKTLQDLKEGDFVAEYLGEVVGTKELVRRMDKSKDHRHLYVMQLGTGRFIDARSKGAITRFINHSCEPNCRIEIWTVQGKRRIGVFTIKDIAAGAELSFDYKWKPSSNRAPTRCHCGTATCRGYLEVMDQAEVQLYVNERKGVWRKPTDEETQEWLVNKRIKVWWEGNQRFFEADVLSYNFEERKYQVVYLIDGNAQEEDLDGGAKWELLDETQEEFRLLKRHSSQGADDDADIDWNDLPFAMPIAVPTQEQKVIRSAGSIRHAHPMSRKFRQHLAQHATALVQDIEAEFGVRIILGSMHSTAESVTLYGPPSELPHATRRLDDAQHGFFATMQNEEQQARTSALRQQAVGMANDWRFNYSDVPACTLQHETVLPEALPRAENAAFQARCGALLDSAMRNLGYRGTLRIHASFLLMRTLATSKDLAVVTETFGLVASSIFLAMKAHGCFSVRKSKEVAQALYAVEHGAKVKSRELQEHHRKFLSIEPKQLQLLRHDLHVFDIIGLMRVHFPQCNVYKPDANLVQTGLEHLELIAHWLGELVSVNLPWLMLPNHLALAGGALLVQYVRVAFGHRHSDLTDEITFEAQMRHMAALYEVALFHLGVHREDLQAVVLWLAARYLTAVPSPAHSQQASLWDLDPREVEVILTETGSLFPACVGEAGRLIQRMQDGLIQEPKPHAHCSSLRKPWLTARDCDAVLDSNGASIVGSITNDLVAIKVFEQDLEAINCAHVQQLATPATKWFWEALIDPGEAAGAELEQLRLCLRRLPLTKDFAREQKKLEQQSAEVGLSPLACNELYMFEHIHASTGQPGGSPHLVVPLALTFAPRAHRSGMKLNRAGSTPAQSDSGTRTPGEENSGDVDASDTPRDEAQAPGEEFTQDDSVNMSFDQSPSASDLSKTFKNGAVSSPNASRVSLSSQPMTKSDQPELYMVIPPIEMPLSAIIHEACRTPLDDDIVRLLCRDLLSALLTCKRCGIHFKWLEATHVYVSSDGYLQLGSLSSAYLESAVEDMPDNAGATRPSKLPNLSSCSPELLLGDKATTASSVWVAACIATMLMTGKAPFKADAEEKQLEYIFRACGTPRACDRAYAQRVKSLSHYKQLWGEKSEDKNYKPRLGKYLAGLKHMTPDRVSFLEGMLELVPAKRSSIEQLLSHPFIASAATVDRADMMHRLRGRLASSVLPLSMMGEPLVPPERVPTREIRSRAQSEQVQISQISQISHPEPESQQVPDQTATKMDAPTKHNPEQQVQAADSQSNGHTAAREPRPRDRRNDSRGRSDKRARVENGALRRPSRPDSRSRSRNRSRSRTRDGRRDSQDRRRRRSRSSSSRSRSSSSARRSSRSSRASHNHQHQGSRERQRHRSHHKHRSRSSSRSRR